MAKKQPPKKAAETKKSSKIHKKLYSELDLKMEVRRSITIAAIMASGQVVNQLIKWGCIAVCFMALTYAIVKIAPHLAGKNTSLDVEISFLREFISSGLGMFLIVSISLNVLLSLVWFLERRTRKILVGRMATRKVELEELIDPDRSTSGMNRDGSAPEDL